MYCIKTKKGFWHIFFIFWQIAGCVYKSPETKDFRQMQVESICRSIMKSSDFPSQTKELAAKTLRKWNNRRIDPVPVLLHAGYVQSKKGQWFINLVMSDEEFDIDGLIIKEVLAENGNTITMEETYPLFTDKHVGHFQCIEFKPRAIGEQQIHGAPAADSEYPLRPTLFISIPEKDKITVEIKVYDKKGHISNIVLFEPFIEMPRDFEWLKRNNRK